MIKKLLYKNPIKFCISFFIIGIIVGFTISVIAESINSDEVLYDNSNSSSNTDNVQDAIDGLYNIVDKVGSGFALIASNPTNLSSELIGGLYRYQGIQDGTHNVDNYICFGTTNKSDCVSNSGIYMYRIIGINENGQMKLIKKDALDTIYKWNSSGGVDWVNSDLYVGLNGSYFLTNTTYIPDSSWSNRIAFTDWHYGRTHSNYSALEMYNNEMGLSGIVNAKIGLIYLHDYYYGLSGGNNCYSSGSTCKTSWIHLLNNDSNPPDSEEWTITRFRTNDAWIVCGNGDTNYETARTMTSTDAVRPVFFLGSSERIVSGSGTLANPYILS